MQTELTHLCRARTRAGTPCSNFPVTGKRRCRMHGGAAGSGAPEGERNGNWKGGRYSKARRAEFLRQTQERQAREQEWRKRLRLIIGSIPPAWAERPEWKERIRRAEERRRNG